MNKLVTFAGRLPEFWKTIMAIVPMVLFVGAEVVQAVANGAEDGSFTLQDGIQIAVVGIAAYGVYKKTNRAKAVSPADE